MSDPLLSVLIPAAGASQRLGQAKQLVQYNGKPLIRVAVENASSLAPAEIIVVTGAQAEEVKAAVRHPGVHWVHNPDWTAGMGGSIATGAAMISAQSGGLLVLLCDQWKIDENDLQKLVAAWRSDPQRIAVAEAHGILMPPVVFPASCFARLRQLQGRRGARSLIESNPDLVTSVPMNNAVFDLDTESQLDNLA